MLWPPEEREKEREASREREGDRQKESQREKNIWSKEIIHRKKFLAATKSLQLSIYQISVFSMCLCKVQSVELTVSFNVVTFSKCAIPVQDSVGGLYWSLDVK